MLIMHFFINEEILDRWWKTYLFNDRKL